MKRLKDYAKEQGVQYRTAWNRYKAGKIAGAFQNEFGQILIDENKNKPDYTICYCRVSSSQNKNNLEKQAERLVSYCAAKGYRVDEIIKECASGLNDKRPKLIKMLNNTDVTCIVVEHHDRLTRFGFNYIQNWMNERGCLIEVINPATNDKDDLMKDFVSLVTSFTARLYGLRRSKRRTERLIKELNDENNSLK
ncbi:MAG: IS607 family transposase [Gammaproteobacteria bacterium]|nr:IS607 family transposase [Thiomargarita sp.]RKZ38557.1 MAG: IS607 family transposase [Gammaproteobacteria bacterium]RKZ43613.1 MAG: IS607 family transposase [Gammaproteobacteria bacterium]